MKEKRIRVFSNLAISLDGKIAPFDRNDYPLGTKTDLQWLRALRNQSDVVVMGASTLRAWKRPCLAAKASHRVANAILTSDGRGLDPEWAFFTSDRIDRIIFHTKKLRADLVKKLGDKTRLIAIRGDRNPAPQINAALVSLGYRRILVEGGGGLMWEYARENLIQDYYVTLTPKILGGTTAPTLVAGAGFPAGEELNLRLKAVKKVGSELYLRYGPKQKP